MRKRRPPFFAAPKADLRERLKIAGGAVVAAVGGVAVGIYLSNVLYRLP